MQGKLIVIEGGDGAGKTTQVSLLSKGLKDKNIPHEVISFPRYEDNLYGGLIKRYLEGEFGSIEQVNPYLVALAFAGDRALAKSQIKQWLDEGKIVIANRYVPSSKAHLSANLPQEKREEFIKWLDNLEYGMGAIKEDLVILLNVDPKVGQKNAQDRNLVDLHEESLEHLNQTSKIYLELSKQEDWVVVNCMEDDKMKPIEDIHQEVWKILENKIKNGLNISI